MLAATLRANRGGGTTHRTNKHLERRFAVIALVFVDGHSLLLEVDCSLRGLLLKNGVQLAGDSGLGNNADNTVHLFAPAK